MFEFLSECHHFLIAFIMRAEVERTFVLVSGIFKGPVATATNTSRVAPLYVDYCLRGEDVVQADFIYDSFFNRLVQGCLFGLAFFLNALLPKLMINLLHHNSTFFHTINS